MANSPTPENFIAVAEATIGLVLMLLKRVKHNEAKLRRGEWAQRQDRGERFNRNEPRENREPRRYGRDDRGARASPFHQGEAGWILHAFVLRAGIAEVHLLHLAFQNLRQENSRIIAFTNVAEHG